jgi:response regulator NasT
MKETTVRPAPRDALPHAPAGGLNVVVAHADPDTVQLYEAALARLGHRACPAAAGDAAAELCRLAPTDLLIVDARLPGLTDALAACRERAVPALLVAGDAADGAAGDDAVYGCLPGAAADGDLGPAVATARRLFEQAQAHRAEAAALRQQLEDRKLIERAKGAVSRRCGLEEARAYEALRKHASDHNRKLADTARAVLEAEAVFAQLESVDGHRPARSTLSSNGHSHGRH